MLRTDEVEIREVASLLDLKLLLSTNNEILDQINEKLRELIYQLRRVLGDS